MIGVATGSLDTALEFRALGVRTLLVLDLLLVIQFWAELKPRLLRLPYGRLIHYAFPVVAGAAAGGYVAFKNRTDVAEQTASAAMRWMTPTSGLVALIAAALLSLATATLFVRRDTYVS